MKKFFCILSYLLWSAFALMQLGYADGIATSSNAVSANENAFRTWTSAQNVSVDASVVRIAEGIITLRKRDGSLVTIPVNMLSNQDQQFLGQHLKIPTSTSRTYPVTGGKIDKSEEFQKKGYRHWEQFEQTPIVYDYVAGLFRGEQKFFYLACARKAGKETGLLERSIAGKKMGKPKWLFSSKLIDDVYLPKKPETKSPFIQMARTCIVQDDEAGLVCLNSVFSGKYGSSPLEPALFSSKTGKPGTWDYHGKMTFDPPASQEKRIREGAIVRAPDGGWRIYLAGYGVTVAMAESKTLDGPWRLASRTPNQLIDVAALLEKAFDKGNGGCFPYVIMVSDTEYHLWISEGWPCKAIWHLSSTDGLNFSFYGSQPEILPNAAGRKAMKGVRAFVSPDGKTIHGYIPFHVDGKGWVIYESTMPAGLQP